MLDLASIKPETKFQPTILATRPVIDAGYVAYLEEQVKRLAFGNAVYQQLNANQEGQIVALQAALTAAHLRIAELENGDKPNKTYFPEDTEADTCDYCGKPFDHGHAIDWDNTAGVFGSVICDDCFAKLPKEN